MTSTNVPISSEPDFSPPELLMPAGSIEKLRFAFAYGADAVYAGVPIFSLRARENEFRIASVAEGIDYAHKFGKKIYITVNIFAHNSKIDGFLDSFCQVQDLCPDGFIMADPGLIAKARRLRPEAVIHLSTQANATNWASVEFWRDMGIKRVVLSRELSLKEISSISQKVPDIELEAFVHGAICIAHSGRCLISNYLNHRDANQGTCTNSCRWEYKLSSEIGSLEQVESNRPAAKDSTNYQPIDGTYLLTEPNKPEDRYEVDEDEHGTYLMNSRDLCAIELLADLHQSGVCSLKVEGRTKSIYYVSLVARAYRRAIDDMIAGRPFNPDNLKELMSTSNRTLMTGFLKRNPNHYGENFDDGGSKPLTHRFAGVVREYDEARSMALVEVRNRFECGDSLEWLTPTDTVHGVVRHIEKRSGERVNEAHGGAGLYWMPSSVRADEFTILRAQLG